MVNPRPVRAKRKPIKMVDDGEKTIEQLYVVHKIGREPIINKLLGGYDATANKYGIEIEIEGLGHADCEGDPYGEIKLLSTRKFEGYKVFWIEEEASLKEVGMEFISFPMNLPNIKPYLEFMFESIQTIFPKATFTNRCSIHVHQNVGDLRMFEVVGISKLHAIFEDVLFEFVGNNRKENPFCRPVKNTNSEFFLPSTKEFDRAAFNVAEADDVKYSAFNVAPIKTYGTIEYRHMPGTWDIDKILTFINILDYFKETAKKESWDNLNSMILQINTISNYKEFVYKVLNNNNKLISSLFPTHNFKSIEDGVTVAKRLILGAMPLIPAKLRTTLKNNTIVQLLESIEKSNERKYL